MNTPDFPKEIVAALVTAIVSIAAVLGVELSQDTEQVLVAVIGGVTAIAVAVAGWIRKNRAANADKIAESRRVLANPKMFPEGEFTTEPTNSGQIYEDDEGLDRGTSRYRDRR